jgi:hypothetical protein
MSDLIPSQAESILPKHVIDKMEPEKLQELNQHIADLNKLDAELEAKIASTESPFKRGILKAGYTSFKKSMNVFLKLMVKYGK